ncbi:MAG: hypothetical protein U0804_11840 [Gemmataceae bacterium]
MSRRSWVSAAALVVFGTGIGLYSFRPTPSAAQPPAGGAAGGSKYTVVETEGTNLLVVDNSTNTMFYYTVDPGQEVGSPLHLRGSIDLTQVGKSTITVTSAKKGGKGATP